MKKNNKIRKGIKEEIRKRTKDEKLRMCLGTAATATGPRGGADMTLLALGI